MAEKTVLSVLLVIVLAVLPSCGRSESSGSGSGKSRNDPVKMNEFIEIKSNMYSDSSFRMRVLDSSEKNSPWVRVEVVNTSKDKTWEPSQRFRLEKDGVVKSPTMCSSSDVNPKVDRASGGTSDGSDQVLPVLAPGASRTGVLCFDLGERRCSSCVPLDVISGGLLTVQVDRGVDESPRYFALS
jgi:hypothetical protein